MAVRAKFKCQSKIDYSDGKRIDLNAVYSGSPENEEFFKATPSGNLTLWTVNPKAAEQFEVGKEYYIDFTPATPVESLPEDKK